MPSRTCLIALLLAASATISALATTYHVPDPYPTIQSGIDAASAGDTVLVACGTYYEHDIEMKSGILLLSETGEADCVTIDAQQEIGRRVLYCVNVDDSTLIKGFTLTGGLLGTPESELSGGGVYCENSSPTFEYCVIQNNHAMEGGGVYCDDSSSPTFKFCLIRGNGSFMGSGGGVLCRNHSSLVLIDVTFESNGAGGIEGGYGGALVCGEARLTDCEFIGNIAAMGGAAMVCGSVSLERVLFDSNDATGMHGGPVMTCSGETVTLTDVTFSDNMGNCVLALEDCTAATLTRATFAGNDAVGVYFSGCSPTLASCTFYGNWYGLDCMDGASPTLERTILAFSVYGQAIYCHDANSQPMLECCDIFGNEGGDWVGCIEEQYGVDGNISEDPLFCDPENGDLTLQEDSPCAPFSPPNQECDLIGAWPVGCGPPTAAEHTTWGRIKVVYGR